MPTRTRINSIDLLRGIAMIIMALDHTRDYFHAPAFLDDPLNLQTTTPALFFTRWITHMCAPTFVFLAGTSAFLQGLRKTKKQLSLFLLTRGLWLLFVEVVIMTFGISFDIYFQFFILQTIWAIGISMIVLSAVIWLPFPLILTLGLVIVLGHNTLDFYEAKKSNFPIWYSFLHFQGIYPVGQKQLLIYYPFLPWAGVMILGYCFGKYYLHDIMNRNKRALLMGVGMVALFIIIRLTNSYGDPSDWNTQQSSLYTFFSFIRTQKYPPSLLFICMTIGPSLILLGLLGNVKNKLADVITVYGRVPLFFYVLHFYLLHLLSMIMFLLNGHTFQEGMKGVENEPFKFLVPGEGYGLGPVYLIWIAVVISLYPLCKWFADYKKNHPSWWVSYL